MTGLVKKIFLLSISWLLLLSTASWVYSGLELNNNSFSFQEEKVPTEEEERESAEYLWVQESTQFSKKIVPSQIILLRHCSLLYTKPNLINPVLQIKNKLSFLKVLRL